MSIINSSLLIFGTTSLNWSNVFKYNNKTLSQICEEGKHCAVYAPLIVNDMGAKVITDRCKGFYLSPTHILGK
jgi:hypothetical protein